MHIDSEKRVCFSKAEMKVITAALLVLYNEICALEKCKEFKRIRKQFVFSIEDLKYVKDWFIELYNQWQEQTYIFYFEDIYKKLSLIYAVLYECSRNFDKYEVSEVGEITEDELNVVLKDTKNTVSVLESDTNKIMCAVK